jgi:hypothetical protein
VHPPRRRLQRVCSELGVARRERGGLVRASETGLSLLAAAQDGGQEENHVANFRRRGYTMLPSLLGAGQVRRLQLAFERATAAAVATSENKMAAGDARYWDIPRAVESDDVFLELLDSELLALLLQQVVGSDAHAIQVQARTVPPVLTSICPTSGGPCERPASYTTWHRDFERGPPISARMDHSTIQRSAPPSSCEAQTALPVWPIDCRCD